MAEKEGRKELVKGGSWEKHRRQTLYGIQKGRGLKMKKMVKI